MESSKDSRVISFERRWHSPTPEEDAPARKIYIKAKEVRRIVTEQIGPKMAKSFQLYTADSEYFCTPEKDAQQIIAESSLDRKRWVSERFDCDDFALVLKAHFAEAAYVDGSRRAAHCFGIVWGNLPGPHAINWMINDDMKLRFVEPQNDDIFSPRDTDRDIYFMLV